MTRSLIIRSIPITQWLGMDDLMYTAYAMRLNVKHSYTLEIADWFSPRNTEHLFMRDHAWLAPVTLSGLLSYKND